MRLQRRGATTHRTFLHRSSVRRRPAWSGAGVLTAGVVGATQSAVPGPAVPSPAAAGGGALRVAATGGCIDTPSASTASGVPLQQYTCNGTGAQESSLVQE